MNVGMMTAKERLNGTCYLCKRSLADLSVGGYRDLADGVNAPICYYCIKISMRFNEQDKQLEEHIDSILDDMDLLDE